MRLNFARNMYTNCHLGTDITLDMSDAYAGDNIIGFILYLKPCHDTHVMGYIKALVVLAVYYELPVRMEQNWLLRQWLVKTPRHGLH